MLRLNGKSKNGTLPTIWDWQNNRAVTGHRRNGKLVDVRKASMEVYITEGGELVARFIPAKGVDLDPEIVGLVVTEERKTVFGRCRAYKVFFRFFDTPVELKLPLRHQVLLD